jgi:pyruvate/2-oxoglutarate dehydrogenase complex dihydrolipoamide dehydrogenase (E3) component
MEVTKTDLCVIGAGAGGLSVAAGAVQMGARVVLIEGGEMGGDCLNHGCVPSKALLHAGRAGMDWRAAHEHVAAVIAGIAPHDSEERFAGLGVDVIRDWAQFSGPREVSAGGRRIRARRFVIATGSRPFMPGIPGLEDVPYERNETIFQLEEQPRHLIIIGAGPIGMEMAEAHRALGCEVTVLEGARALGREDEEAAALVLAAQRERGIVIEEHAQVARVSGKPGAISVETAGGALFEGSHLLIAVGRRANTERLALGMAGVETTRAGIRVDARLRTTNRRIHAIGDVAGGLQFTHLAGYHAGVIIRSALFGLPAKVRHDHIPRATYTSPELAQIGMTEEEARGTHGTAVEVYRVDFADNDRARAGELREGFLKLMAHKGRPVGVTIAGPGAGELITPWALAFANRLKLGQIAGMVAPYPTMGEITKRAAGAYFTPRLFENPRLKTMVGLVQKWLP